MWNIAKLRLNNEVERTPLPIVADAGVASVGVADGRLVPVVIVDTSTRPDVDHLIEAHRCLGPGDVESGWYRPSKRDDGRIGLFLNITRPARCVVLIEFDIATRGGLVDAIVRAQGLYLQGGRAGDRLKSTMSKGRILAEVPSRTFQPEWDRLFPSALERYFRTQGYKKPEAKRMADEFVARWRTLTGLRLHDH